MKNYLHHYFVSTLSFNITKYFTALKRSSFFVHFKYQTEHKFVLEAVLNDTMA